MKTTIALPTLGLLMLFSLGCGQSAKDPNRPTTYPVTGTVTLDGQPVQGATVNFQLADGSKGAVGVTDASGNYALSTFSADDGAVAGQYRVAISKYEKPAEAGGSGSIDDGNYVGPEAGGQTATAAAKNLLPPKYADAMNSGLTATVSESGNNRFDFALEGATEKRTEKRGRVPYRALVGNECGMTIRSFFFRFLREDSKWPGDLRIGCWPVNWTTRLPAGPWVGCGCRVVRKRCS